MFSKDYTPICTKEIFVTKHAFPWTKVIEYLNGEEITGTFYD